MRREIAAELGLSKLEELEPSDRIPRHVLDDLWTRIPALGGDPDFGLHFAERASPSALGLLGYLARHSATVGDAVARVVRYQRLLMDASDVDATFAADGSLTVSDGPLVGSDAWPRHLAEAVMGCFLTLAARWSGASVRARSAAFQHAEPPDLAAHLALFGCRPRFLQPRNQIVLTADVARVPMRDADAVLVGYLEQAAEARLEEVPHPDEWVERLVGAIEAELGNGLSLGGVAERLHVGPRTLQRRIAELGLSYQGLVDSVRRRRAEVLLRDPRLGLEEITERLGFADPSGFRRAYLRWTGTTPRGR
ncbi:AraC family transcriptional regulator [Nannocystis radixulma]|uniref:AraC family transcriptional regulator n=1 Tax=Nannocystis radixulma TaxID=2995305 RepID=A0ABT5AZU8_9BACT|nr:AraC family transcriptional regulator [Nannocystis radixulma]MDC0667365.1 AraC family transcriptional regulator [Nannocystis radixulma]